MYHLDLPELTAVEDQDFIGTRSEGNTAVFFHKNKDHFVEELCGGHSCSIVYLADLDYHDWETGQKFSFFNVGLYPSQ